MCVAMDGFLDPCWALDEYGSVWWFFNGGSTMVFGRACDGGIKNCAVVSNME